MAKKKEEQNLSFIDKVKNAFVRFGKWVAGSFKDMYHELKKVIWPSRKELINYSLVVIAFMVAMGIVIGLIDFGAGKLVSLLIS